MHTKIINNNRKNDAIILASKCNSPSILCRSYIHSLPIYLFCVQRMGEKIDKKIVSSRRIWKSISEWINNDLFPSIFSFLSCLLDICLCHLLLFFLLLWQNDLDLLSSRYCLFLCISFRQRDDLKEIIKLMI